MGGPCRVWTSVSNSECASLDRRAETATLRFFRFAIVIGLEGEVPTVGAALAPADRTVLPPTGKDAKRLDALADLIHGAEKTAELRSPDGRVTELPTELYAVLRDVVDALSQGQAITIAPHNTVLTTQEAADLLGISRPTLIKLLDRGEIPFTRPSRHRRVLLADVLEYRRRSGEDRREALRELAQLGQEMGETTATFHRHADG